jgi:hypothetical protein
MLSLVLLLLLTVLLGGGVLQIGRYGNAPDRSDWPQLAILTAVALIVAARALWK